MNKEQIIQYYDTCEVDYKIFWDLDKSYAMHAGYWDHQTKNLRQALKRENEILAEIAEIKKGERVLDAGCGVGGSSIFLAKHHHCRVVGITLSDNQQRKAWLNAKEAQVDHLVSFEVQDYTRTRFPSESFDVVWGIESVCHTPDKHLFIQEAFRLLKRGGRLIIADGFATQTHYTGIDEEQMQAWLNGWGVQSLETVSNFKNSLENAHFRHIAYKDVTQNVLPSSKKLYLYSWPALVLSKLGEKCGLRSTMQTKNVQGARCQYQTLTRNLWEYGIFYAQK